MTLGPVSLHASNLEIWVSRHEEEVIINQLLSHLLAHSSKRKVGTSKVTLEVGKGLFHQVLDINSLLLGNSGRETKSIDVATNTDTGRVDRCLLADGAFDLAGIHVACVGGISCDTMVLLDQWIEHVREDLVRIPISGINTTMLIVELHSTSDGFGEREPRGRSKCFYVFLKHLVRCYPLFERKYTPAFIVNTYKNIFKKFEKENNSK